MHPETSWHAKQSVTDALKTALKRAIKQQKQLEI